MSFRRGFEAQQLVELLAVVSSCRDEATAVQAAVECAAQALEAEAACLVLGGDVVTSVGFPAGSRDHDALAAGGVGRRHAEIPGIGLCAVGGARLGEGTDGRLVVARCGGEPFSVEEFNLIRGMARVVGLTLRMLRTLEAERSRQRLVQHLYAVQRAISRRVPHAQVLDMIVGRVLEHLDPGDPEDADGPRGTAVRLWFRDGDAVDGVRLAACAPAGAQQPVPGEHRLRAPVHEDGSAVGTLEVVRPGRPFSATDEEDLLAFAEHVSLAVTDARTLRAVRDAMHDSLTGLASRALFLSLLANELLVAGQRGGRTALMFIDLDRFKQVNDSLGHAAGDQLLLAVAARIRSALRPGDVPARLGGDEFAVLLVDAPGEEEIRALGRRLVELLSRPVPLGGGTAHVGASIGVALGAPEEHDAQDLLRRADAAMYRAKRAGRGRCVLDTDPERAGGFTGIPSPVTPPDARLRSRAR
ncbi:hypothetical protein NUM3379_07780 [Kineococcus sp. NUM-3379]